MEMDEESQLGNMAASSLDAPSSFSASMSPSPSSPSSAPAFELVVLGSGGGPLETNSSGYLLKPYSSSWEDGILALEGGSGLGALATLFEHNDPSTLFPTLRFPQSHDTPLLKAAYVFSFLSCYLITHAHLDHCHSLVLLSGSVPPRPVCPSRRRSLVHLNEADIDTLAPLKPLSATCSPPPVASQPRPPVYAAKRTLERLSLAYGGGLWPELSIWAPERHPATGKKRRLGSKSSLTDDADQLGSGAGTGVELTPISDSNQYFQLHPTLPFSIMKFHALHGCTSHGDYKSSTIFFRYDPLLKNDCEYHMPTPKSLSSVSGATRGIESATSQDNSAMREFVFFGDVEGDWRNKGEEGWDVPAQEGAREMNGKIWEAAAKSWDEGNLAGVFLECSYDSDRPAHLMFGHLHPPSMYHELSKLAKLVKGSRGSTPLQGLKVFVIHIKDELVPHPTGRTPRQRIMLELCALEKAGQLGVDFVEVKQGDRILL